MLFLGVLHSLLVEHPLLVGVLFSTCHGLAFLAFRLSTASAIFIGYFPLAATLLGVVVHSLLVV